MDSLTARKLILKLLPSMAGWQVFTGGVAGKGAPPWIVAGLSESGADVSENSRRTGVDATLDVRVVGRSQAGVNVACQRLSRALDGARTVNPAIAPLTPSTDSGTYPADMTDPETGSPYIMRVLTWRTGW